MNRQLRTSLVTVALLAIAGTTVPGQSPAKAGAKSPWGEKDEIGTLNMMTDGSRLDVLTRIAGGRVYDLAVDLFVGMPACCTPFGDPDFQIWLTRTDPAYADGVSMSTHVGTHIDALNHFGLEGKIWNQVGANEALGVRGWTKSGVDKYPPIVARGVLIDVAGAKEVRHLPASYRISVADLKQALKKQRSTLRPGDVVLTRTGLMTLWPDQSQYRLADQAGLSAEAARWLVEEQKAMLLGADNFGVEHFPSNDPVHLAPVHEYLLVERGVSLVEALWLEDLARDQVYEFLFIASSLKLRGATASPIRPLAIPLRRNQ